MLPLNVLSVQVTCMSRLTLDGDSEVRGTETTERLVWIIDEVCSVIDGIAGPRSDFIKGSNRTGKFYGPTAPTHIIRQEILQPTDNIWKYFTMQLGILQARAGAYYRL